MIAALALLAAFLCGAQVGMLVAEQRLRNGWGFRCSRCMRYLRAPAEPHRCTIPGP